MSDAILKYETEQYIRCCDVPPKVNCCNCPNGISSIWEVQDDLSGMYSLTLPVLGDALRFAWGCTKYENPGVKRLEHKTGPFVDPQPPPSPTYGTCTWGSVSPQQAACCALGCPESAGEPTPSLAPITILMGCTVYPPTDPIDPIYGWWIDCACDDIWCGDSSEWSSISDCQEFDTNCHCCSEGGAFVPTQGGEEDIDGCEWYRTYYQSLGFECGPCEWRVMQEGYPGTPGYTSHVAGLMGTGCACTRGYVHLGNPADPLTKDMLDSIDSSSLTPFDCEGCNTYVLIQYIADYLDGTPGDATYPCGLGFGHICNGADLPCMDCGCDWGASSYIACLGYPATLTLCPAESINPPSSDSSDCNPNVLCCDEVMGLGVEAQSITAPATPPEDSIHFSFIHTGTSGYLKKDTDGIYRGGVHPIKLEVNRTEQTLNGKKLTMLSDDVFIGRGKIGGEHLGFWVEVMQ